MIPYTADEARKRLLLDGTLITLTRWVDNKVEVLILDPKEVTIKELQNDKQELR